MTSRKTNSRQVKFGKKPSGERDPRVPDEVPSSTKHPIWCFKFFDPDIAFPEEVKLEQRFVEINRHLKDQSQRTWGQIFGNNKRDHEIPIDHLAVFAQRRFQTIIPNEYHWDTLFRFRFSGRYRLWGVLEGAVFHVLWWDPDHKICP